MIDWSHLVSVPGNDTLVNFANTILFRDKSFEFLSLMFLGLMRIIPIVGTAPFLGAKILPMPVKVILGVCLFSIFLPTITQNTLTIVPFNETLLLLAAKEFIIGLILGFFVSIPFNLMQSVGTLIDHQRGSSSLMVSDPNLQNQVSPIGLFFNYILIYLFYITDGPFHFFEVINSSFKVVPPDQFLSANFFNPESSFWGQLKPLMNNFMMLTVQLAAPSLIIILMTDFFLGIANRLAPQVQIIFLGMGLKSTIPLVVIAIGWNLFLQEAVQQTVNEDKFLKQAVIEMGSKVR